MNRRLWLLQGKGLDLSTTDLVAYWLSAAERLPAVENVYHWGRTSRPRAEILQLGGEKAGQNGVPFLYPNSSKFHAPEFTPKYKQLSNLLGDIVWSFLIKPPVGKLGCSSGVEPNPELTKWWRWNSTLAALVVEREEPLENPGVDGIGGSLPLYLSSTVYVLFQNCL